MAEEIQPVRPRGAAARGSFASGAAACGAALLLGLVAVVLLGLGQLPAILLLGLALALAVWGAQKLKKAEPGVR
jgi:hypothetical protein